jgi:molecular chaperone DnaK
MLIDEARQAIKEEAPLDRIRGLTSDLQQVLQSLNAAAAAAGAAGAGAAGAGAAGGAGAGAGATAGAPGGGDADDVIDADYTTG